MEQSVHAGALPERVRELGEWLAAQGEPGLTTTFDLWLGAMGRKWGVDLHQLLRAPAVMQMPTGVKDRS